MREGVRYRNIRTSLAAMELPCPSVFMACVLCTPFSRPAFSAPETKTEYGGTHQRTTGLPLEGVSSQPAARPAVRCLTSNSMIRSTCTVNGEVLKPSRHLCVPNSSCPTVFSSIHMIISGYWVGPDIEDGWGYVEASVNLVSDY